MGGISRLESATTGEVALHIDVFPIVKACEASKSLSVWLDSKSPV